MAPLVWQLMTQTEAVRLGTDFWFGVFVGGGGGGIVVLMALTEFMRRRFVSKGEAINEVQLNAALREHKKENAVEREKELADLRTRIQTDVGHASLLVTQQLSGVKNSIDSFSGLVQRAVDISHASDKQSLTALQEAKSTRDALNALKELFETRFGQLKQSIEHIEDVVKRGRAG